MVTVGTPGNPRTSAAITSTTAETATPIADPPSNPPHVPRRGAEAGEGDDDDD
ncbi:hypothetical protein F4560_002746 [Saccharothrix ecbatanensis]|uniref:Uncharacterized protein n=2 Tax=Saccharothrix ecbatanensis TaxID=1105145 RepID=A0A7W9M0N5_9PSEU|nr:hypothetical protein [Saccharothrix ecbatanensis]